MVWKVIAQSDAGTSTIFGSNDLDKVAQYLNGNPEVDPAFIKTSTTYRDNKLKVSNPAETFSYTIRSATIGANYDLALPLCTGNDTLLSANASATIKNKIIDSSNTFNAVMGFPTARKWGIAMCANTNEAGDGLLSGYLKTGTVSANTVGSTGSSLKFTTASSTDAQAGILTNNLIMQRSLDPRLKIKFSLDSTSNQRIYAGLTSNATLTPGTTPLSSSDSGFLLGKRASDTNFQLIVNDGNGSSEIFTDLGVAADTNVHTFEITTNDALGTMYWSFDGSAPVGISSRIPGTGTDLKVHVETQASSSTAKAFNLFYVEAECDL